MKRTKLSGRGLVICLMLILSAICGSSCGGNRSYVTIDGYVQGTTYHMVYQPQNADQADQMKMRDKIEKLLADFDTVFSGYVAESVVCRINQAQDLRDIELNDWFAECFKLSQSISENTGGAFDITLKPVIEAYGFGASGRGGDSMDQRQLDSLMSLVGYQYINLTDDGSRLERLKPGIQLDFNAIAQGYSVDVVASMFDSMGVENYMVEIGGEVFCRGLNPKGDIWRVGIDRPVEGNVSPGKNLQAVISIVDNGLATSGNYRKYRVLSDSTKVTHTIDPATGRSVVSNLLSATIVAPTAALADGYATACMVLGLDGAKRLLDSIPGLDGYLVYSQGSRFEVYMTEGIMQKVEQM